MKKDAIITHIQSASRKLMQQLGILDDHASPIKSISQSHALLELHTYKTMNMLQLARILNLEQYTTSRLVMQLVSNNLCTIQRDINDRRNKLISLTDKGSMLAQKIHKESHLQMQQALNLINKKEREIIAQGLSLYAQVLNQSRLREACRIRKSTKKDMPQLINLAKFIHMEYGLYTNHQTILFVQHELNEIKKIYTGEKSENFVIVHNAEIVGCCGYSPLSDDNKDICTLRALYLSPQIRGLGLGTRLVQKVLHHAKSHGFKLCYSEDYGCMQDPTTFYKRLEFKKSESPAIATKHNLKSSWYVKEL